MALPEELLEKCPDLASLPAVYHQLNEAINSPSCTTGIISRIISQDPSLTIKVLKMVNSAFYGFPHEIEDIPQAIVIIGLQQLNDLVLTHSIINLFNNKKTAPFSLEDFWKFSLASGLEAKILASYSNCHFSERVFVCGLLHSIGKLLMATAEPEKYSDCYEESLQKNILITDAENTFFGYSHIDVNKALMTSWNIPHAITDVVSHYDNPEQAEHQQESSLVLLSHTIIQTIGLGNCGDYFISKVKDQQLLDLELSTAKIEESLIPLHNQFHDIANSFLG